MPQPIWPTIWRSTPLFSAIPFVGLATGALFPLIALDLDRFGYDKSFIGGTTSLYYLGTFLGAILYGRLVARIGYRRGFAVAAGILAISTLCLTATSDPAVWLVVRFVTGAGLGATYVVTDSWISALSPAERRGQMFAAYETIRLGAVSLGPALLLVAVSGDAYVLVAAMYLCAVLPAGFAPEPTVRISSGTVFSGLRDVAAWFPAPLFLIFIGGLANASFYGLGAVYAVDRGMDETAIALFVGGVLFAPVVAELPVGVLADRLRRMPVAMAISAGAAMAASAMAVLQPATLYLALPLGFCVSAGVVPLYSLGLTRIVDGLGAEEALRAGSAGLLAYTAGGICGPALAGVAMGTLGAEGLYWCLATVTALAALAAWLDRYSPCCPECCPEVGSA